MDYQAVFNLAVTVAAFFGGWTLSHIYQAIDGTSIYPKSYFTLTA